jgi:pimeloyl-ACP methyl ester carboxylesterase
MKRLVQEKYAYPQNAAALGDEPLVVHQRTEVTANDKLVIFVHGLGGQRYGDSGTWGKFPAFLFEDLPDTDVGMYQYETATGRWLSSKSVSIDREARVFADLIRDALRDYKSIALVGHSMGGLLCKAVIKALVDAGLRNALARICGLILMATPQLGSLRMPGFLSLFSHDARALKPHGELVLSINRTFEDHVALDENIATLRKVTIPTWAVEGVSDFWVDPLSSGIGLTSSRRKVVRGSHTSIVKPPDKSADAYAWVKERVEKATRRYEHDVFIAAAMAGHEGDEHYKASRKAVLDLKAVLEAKNSCRSVFYAGANIASKKEFDDEALALEFDLRKMRASRNFILYFPEKIASSVLFEAGWALVLGKPSIYIVRDRKQLPYLLNNASQAFREQRVRVFEFADDEEMLTKVASYGDRLFDYKDDSVKG